MTIRAKYRGKCSECGGEILPGQEIEWKKGEQSRHATCSAPAPAAPAPAPAFTPTREQTVALDLFATGSNLAIEAGAGTGKTSTLLLLANSTERRGQYIAFNKAIVTEAESKMPANVKADTAHRLAMRAVGRKFAHRLRSPRMRSDVLAAHLQIDGVKVGEKYIGGGFLAGHVMAGITRFCQGADPAPDWRHIPYIEGIDEMVDGKRTYGNNDAVRRSLQPALDRAWADLNREDGVLPYRHDHYLKLWQLSDPKIQADFILFDEAQDANPVMVAIVAAQTHAQLVWVGDSQQQIYSFTGAINALASVPSDHRAFLTQSFRFGPEVARVANTVLDVLGADLRLVGTESIESTVGTVAEPDAILTRTNAQAVHTVLSQQRAGMTACLVGGGDEVVRFARGADDLIRGGSSDHPDLACFVSWAEVKTYVDEDQQGGELRLLVKLVEEFGVRTILDALDRTVREEDADVIVSTAHKSKGREWNAVQLAGDFPEDNPSDEELRLLYVACTRAKRDLDIDAVGTFKTMNGNGGGA